jgi:hypothetical protein
MLAAANTRASMQCSENGGRDELMARDLQEGPRDDTQVE